GMEDPRIQRRFLDIRVQGKTHIPLFALFPKARGEVQSVHLAGTLHGQSAEFRISIAEFKCAPVKTSKKNFAVTLALPNLDLIDLPTYFLMLKCDGDLTLSMVTIFQTLEKQSTAEFTMPVFSDLEGTMELEVPRNLGMLRSVSILGNTRHPIM